MSPRRHRRCVREHEPCQEEHRSRSQIPGGARRRPQIGEERRYRGREFRPVAGGIVSAWTLRELNPALIYSSISGFGQTGPPSTALGYDNILQAFTGMMDMNGDKDGAPTPIPFSPIDQTTGLNATIGIQAAVLNRQPTGEGAYLEVSLFETRLIGIANDRLWQRLCRATGRETLANHTPSDPLRT